MKSVKKYITPEMDINMFISENIITTSETAQQTEYVTALEGVTDKAQVNMNELNEITKFTF